MPIFALSGKLAYKPGLERMQNILERLGNPHHQFKSVQIAGTNGKGTVTAMVSSILISAGYKTASYFSPHLIRINERFQIDGKEIEDNQLLEIANKVIAFCDDVEPSYFELLTLIAFEWFAQSEVDLAVVEVGLGGRLDATTVLSPIVTAITSIGLDHQDILGYTLKEILREKAGIYKPGIPMVIGTLDDHLKSVIHEIVPKNELIFTNDYISKIESDTEIKWDGEKIQLPLRSEVMVRNGLTAALIISLLPLDLGSTAVKRGLESYKNLVYLPGRFEKLHSDLMWFFDGGHNEIAIESQKEMIKEIAPLSEITVICTFMRDKDPINRIKQFSDFKKIIYYSVSSDRAASYSSLEDLYEGLIPANNECIQEILRQERSNPVLFTGSFYFYQTVKWWVNQFFSTT